MSGEEPFEECAAGADGPKGYQGSRGVKGDTGPPEIVSTNWRHCTWYHKNDGNDNAQVASCSFTKEYSDTSLYVALSGNLRVAYTNNACGRWFFTFNGNECSNPNRIEAVVYAGGLSNHNLHRPRVVFGHCNGLSAGSYTVGFHVGNCAGYGYYDTYTGWNSAMHLMIEERTPSPY